MDPVEEEVRKRALYPVEEEVRNGERERDLYPMEGGVKKRVEENKNKLSEIKRESSIQWKGSGKESRVE